MDNLEVNSSKDHLQVPWVLQAVIAMLDMNADAGKSLWIGNEQF